MESLKYSGKLEDLTGLGNVPVLVSGDLPQRKITLKKYSDGLPGLILKEYTMKEKGGILPTRWDLVEVDVFLKDELKKGNIKPLSGMGFSILSTDVLNVCRWDSESVDVVVPQIYTLEDGLWTLQKVESVGAFCSGEKRVYDHENNAWLEYIESDRTNQDKANYLNNFLIE